MSIVLLFARLLLARIFFVAGFAKLADLPGLRATMHDFGGQPDLPFTRWYALL